MMTVLRKSTMRTLSVGQAAILQNLQEGVPDIGMRLLDFVKENDAIWAAAYGLGQLTAFFIADIAGRRAKQAADGMLLVVFAHIDAEQGVFVIEHKFSQRLRQFGFTHTARTEENEGTNRALGVF